MFSYFEPLLFRFDIVVDHTEEPDLPPLQPYKFISVIHFSIFVEAGIETSILPVDGVFLPEGNHIVEKLVFVLL